MIFTYDANAVIYKLTYYIVISLMQIHMFW